MSGDALSLRNLLRRLDGSAPSIQQTAGAMMKHYDRSAAVAVTEWRNSLQSARPDQMLPLLYVANEVLQTSKRNRGANFLAAFSPVLGQALQHICQSDFSKTEKVRRTIKIWGDRRVFSVRFVNELLQGLEHFRNEKVATVESDLPEVRLTPLASFSPETQVEETAAAEEKQETTTNANGEETEDSDILDMLDDDDDDMDDNSQAGDGGDDDDDDKVFGTSRQLDISIDLNSESVKPSSKNKRRRSSMQSAGSNSSGPKRRRKSALSASNMLDTWGRLVNLDSDLSHAQLQLDKIDTVMAKTPASELEGYVGDELQAEYKQMLSYERQIGTQRQTIWDVAEERHTIEGELLRYLPWLEKALQQDEDDLVFCDMLTVKLQAFGKLHGALIQARDDRVLGERRARELVVEREQKQREEEEAKEFRDEAFRKETEAKPGMVWNPATREYQALNTEESWRD